MPVSAERKHSARFRVIVGDALEGAPGLGPAVLTRPYDRSVGNSETPVVGIAMGSDSDWPTMRAAAEVLDRFGVPYEARVLSAHRTPRTMLDWGQAAAGRGLKVVIAGAGGAAHLPGMLAAATTLPVIGVPVVLKTLDGLDSLLSIVQMPTGVPVATVAIGNAANAGLLAVRILGTGDARLAAALTDYAADLERQVAAKDAALGAAG